MIRPWPRNAKDIDVADALSVGQRMSVLGKGKLPRLTPAKFPLEVLAAHDTIVGDAARAELARRERLEAEP